MRLSRLLAALCSVLLFLILSPQVTTAASADPASDRSRGLEFAGLVTSTDPLCRGLLAAGKSGACTHGPDPAPMGVDVTRERSTEELKAEVGYGTAASTVGT